MVLIRKNSIFACISVFLLAAFQLFSTTQAGWLGGTKALKACESAGLNPHFPPPSHSIRTQKKKFQLLSISYGDVLEPPPQNITSQGLLKYLSIGNVKIDCPALYVFGDSYVDNGNNNYLNTTAKSNFPPFGVDFGKPTGRVTNGRLSVDFIAQVAGLPFPPPVLGMSEADKKTIKTGVNYASASAGLLPDAVEPMVPNILPFDTQIDLFENATLPGLKSQFSSNESFSQYMSKAVFFIHIGSNDQGLGWSLHYNQNITPSAYANYLIPQLGTRLQRLYKLGARKILVNNISPMGCMPFNINEMHPKTKCVDEINSRISLYNNQLPDLLKTLQSQLSGSKFVLGDLYKLFEDVYAAPSSYGFTNVSGHCCIDQKGDGTRPCAANKPPCSDRNTLVFFDPFHPTENMHFLWAMRFLKDSSVCSPTLLKLMRA